MAFSCSDVSAAVKRHLGDHHRVAGDVHHHEVVTGHRPQADGIRRVTLRRPVPCAAGVVQEPCFFEETAQVAGLMRAEFLAIRQRQLERRAFQMRQQDFEVIGVDAGVLRRLAKEVLRMLDDELVERRARCHQHRRRRALPPSCAPRTLPGGRDRARISRHHHGVERADIDSQLQRVGRDHAANLALAQLALDFPPLARQVAGAIPANARVRRGPRKQASRR